MSSTDDILFGKIALNMHLIERNLLERALAFQKAQAPLVPLGELLYQRGVLTREQISQVLARQQQIKQAMSRPSQQQGPENGSTGLVDSWSHYAPTPQNGGTQSFSPGSQRPAYPTPLPGPMSGGPMGQGHMAQGPSMSPGPMPGGPMHAPADPADNLINTMIGGCHIVAKIGEGGMGAIYRARHEALRKDVVVKILPPESAANPRTVERFKREAIAAAKLEHPNIVQVLNVGTTDRGLHFIVMQYVDGKNLEDTIQERGRHPWKEAVRIVQEIARGLTAAHKAGVIHRDIKADNILITPQGVVKLADFGLAKDLNSDMKLTADGAMIGTPLYMAPEIGRVKEIDGRVDVYSLGVTFYYLLTGIQPFRAFPAIEILSAKAHDKLKPPEQMVPDLPEPVRNVLGKMLEKDRDKRYADCDVLVRDLEALDRGFPVDAGEPSLWGPRGSKPPSDDKSNSPTLKSGRLGRNKAVSASSSKRIPRGGKSAEPVVYDPGAASSRRYKILIVLIVVVILILVGLIFFFFK